MEGNNRGKRERIPWGKTSNDRQSDGILYFELTLRLYEKRKKRATRKRVAEGFIVPAREVHWCDLELLLWKSVVVAGNEDDGDSGDDDDEDEVGLDDRLDSVETIRYFSMARAPRCRFLIRHVSPIVAGCFITKFLATCGELFLRILLAPLNNL